jgi:hypothetical protein
MEVFGRLIGCVCEKTNLLTSGITPLVVTNILWFIHVFGIHFEPKLRTAPLHSSVPVAVDYNE